MIDVGRPPAGSGSSSIPNAAGSSAGAAGGGAGNGVSASANANGVHAGDSAAEKTHFFVRPGQFRVWFPFRLMFVR